jgi:hypothetical protein
MFDHTLDALKGWPSPTAVDIDGTLSSNVNLGSVGATVFSGCCVHVASTTTGGGGTGTTNNVPIAVFEMGANLNKMACFLWVGNDGYDVTNPGVPAGTILGGTPSIPPAWIPIRPTGKLMALVAIGGYELETTEFDTAQTYTPNQLLRAVTSNTDANGGKLTNQDASGGQAFATSAPLTRYTDSTVGVVSRGNYINKNGKRCLAFWPVYLPGSR